MQVQMKTKDLRDAALEWAVAKAEGLDVAMSPAIVIKGVVQRAAYPAIRTEDCLSRLWPRVPMYCTGPAGHPSPDGDNIIDREGITVVRMNDAYCTDERGFCDKRPHPVWAATLGQFSLENSTGACEYHADMVQIYETGLTYGRTRREAAMRAWVLYNLGSTIEIPEELA